MKKESLFKLIDGFKGKKICVIGDLMLDHFIFGDATRISPEAPVPVVLVEREVFTPGGAGNVAANIASLGGKVWVIGRIGRDAAGLRLTQELQKKAIIDSQILKTSQPTIKKFRVIAGGQQIVRVDHERNKESSRMEKKILIRNVLSGIKDWDVVVVSDYAKGFITPDIVRNIIKIAKKYKKCVIADAKPAVALACRNVDAITPNLLEAQAISKVTGLKEAGHIIQKRLNCSVLITQGAQGMTLFHKNQTKRFPAQAREVFDVAGAGDTVTATLALALASGAKLEDAAFLANRAAGIAVGKSGTAVILPEELKRNLMS
ncbi:MAG: PfkB family carbohydrate kinase [Candidatus Azambacteria bacterium]|nr:PfkB family carbohydrate kinase [Candidatus Azambacteria bacterium]